MARVTQADAGIEYEQRDWDEDTLYPIRLKEISEVYPRGSIGPKGQARKNAAAKVVWETEDEHESWIFDTISLTPSFTGSGVPSKCLQIMCAIAGKDPMNCGEPWIDDASLEFGFEQPGGTANSGNWPVAGRITLNVRAQVRGRITPGRDGTGRTFLNPEKYRAPAPGQGVQRAAQQVANVASDMPLSPDGQWAWNGTTWIPNPNAA